jgi:hypothetical protein
VIESFSLVVVLLLLCCAGYCICAYLYMYGITYGTGEMDP